jgi:hypothetical protein
MPLEDSAFCGKCARKGSRILIHHNIDATLAFNYVRTLKYDYFIF